jgi:type I restriction-modification system DNA methylase subunit
MALFQNSVLQKYLKQQDSTSVAKAYKNFTKYFHNPQIQENIRSSKEEEYQGIFLTELFSKILGYTMKPNADFNLVAEYKNEKNSKKADGAILKDEQAIAVIELKGTNTKDLEKIRQQAFDYKANQTGCVYVITSNYEKLRFYINNAVDFEEFDLFTLSASDFDLLYLCLAKDNMLNNVPLHIKEASVQAEEIITKKFYKDYSNFKRELFRDLVKLNMKNEVFRAELSIEDSERGAKKIKHTLFKKSQKLIDRFLFIFFAEDRGLLPPNSTLQILEQWNRLKDDDAYFPLYHRYKLYFNYLDQGRAGKNGKAEIFAYNGGLFKPDPILDSLLISDELLYKHTKELQAYDFESQVDVNILGHIFENSLNEIESVNAEIEGKDFDKQKSKRKKDGVFYTPKYITKYIVDNTVGKLCTEKKAALGVVEEEYFKSRKGRNTAKLKELSKNLEAYRQWLLHITILDPACGSGAFLNQALDFLIKEHQYIDQLQTNLLGGGLVFPDIENTVLENNIFGVDLNEESVEIARLSLWLRTAQPRRKLNDLSSNIKCGNSLIDSKALAGDKAFKWVEEFPEIFANGGFDVVIGNPPYVNANELKKSLTESQYKYLKSNYTTAKGTVDLYIYFFEKGIALTKQGGILSYITPNRFLSASYGKALRELLIANCEITSLIDYSDKAVFPDASTYPVISFLQHKNKQEYTILTGKFDDVTKQVIESNFPSSKLNILDDSILGFLLNDKLELTEKVINQAESLKNIGKINATSTAKEADDYSDLITESEEGYKLVNTGTIDPYCNMWGKEELTDSGKKLLTPYLPKVSSIISENRHSLYSNPKIIISKIGLQCEAFLDSKGEYASINTNCFHSFSENYTPEYILCWVNSKLYNYTFECFFDGLRMSGGYLLYSAPNLKNTYIKNIDIVKQEPYIKLAKDMSSLINELNIISNKFANYLLSQFSIERLPKKLQNWHDLDFGEFIKELNKAIKKTGREPLSKLVEMEWMEVFETKKAEAQKLKAEIDKTDKEIDAMVYQLYGLTDEEIKIVENS